MPYLVMNEFNEPVDTYYSIKVLESGALVGLDKTGDWVDVYAAGFWSGAGRRLGPEEDNGS